MKKSSLLILFSFFLIFTSRAQEEQSLILQDDYVALLKEEKLAHDIYESFYDIYKVNIFQNILKAETRHFEILGDLINRNSGEESVWSLGETGKFEDAKFQKMYNDLFEKGKVSLTAALEIGALIEETDLRDLSEVLVDEKNQNTSDILQNLISASENHLRAFVTNLSNAGVDYQPVVLAKDKFDNIITGKNGCCSGNKKGKAKGSKSGKKCCSSSK